ncbi:hypothetical protein DMA11_07230 [Marinilabiliaceae bacterium JC017]|nr:hypothetical protein DMA11_07230 [Marinilabiliaceae bacterium JC017]
MKWQTCQLHALSIFARKGFAYGKAGKFFVSAVLLCGELKLLVLMMLEFFFDPSNPYGGLNNNIT